jgi:hypothetical protein
MTTATTVMVARPVVALWHSPVFGGGERGRERKMAGGGGLTKNGAREGSCDGPPSRHRGCQLGVDRKVQSAMEL